MDLQRISVPLKNIANVSKCNGHALQRIFNALKMHYNEKNASTLFLLSLLFPNRVTFFYRWISFCLKTASFALDVPFFMDIVIHWGLFTW